MSMRVRGAFVSWRVRRVFGDMNDGAASAVRGVRRAAVINRRLTAFSNVRLTRGVVGIERALDGVL